MAEATIDATDILSQMLGINNATETVNVEEDGLNEIVLEDAQKRLLWGTCWNAPRLDADKDESKSSQENFQYLFVRLFDGKLVTLNNVCSPSTTILELKFIVQEMLPKPNPWSVDEFKLIFGATTSGIKGDDCTLREWGVSDCSTFTISGMLKGGVMIKPPKYLLDERYNFDFTNVKDTNKTFSRGGYPYIRPCGWKRLGLKVDGKFNNDEWLKGKSPRKDETSSADGEWAISYHGTSLNNGLTIAAEGYKLSKCKRFLYGKGIYSTPDIQVAALYAASYTSEGIDYKVVIQNRVKPSKLKIIPKEETEVGDYWIVPNEKYMRPYGFCVLQVSPSN